MVRIGEVFDILFSFHISYQFKMRFSKMEIRYSHGRKENQTFMNQGLVVFVKFSMNKNVFENILLFLFEIFLMKIFFLKLTKRNLKEKYNRIL